LLPIATQDRVLAMQGVFRHEYCINHLPCRICVSTSRVSLAG